MKTSKLTLNVKLPWWSNSYLWCVGVFAAMHGVEPDYEKIASFLVEHAKMEIV